MILLISGVHKVRKSELDLPNTTLQLWSLSPLSEFNIRPHVKAIPLRLFFVVETSFVMILKIIRTQNF